MFRTRTMVLCVALLAACSGPAPGPTTGSEGERVAVAEVIGDVSYYYVCGGEVLVLPDGRSWYPLLKQGDVDPAGYATPPDQPTNVPDESAVAGLIIAAVVVAVPAPGPGDDVGALTVYEDGIARWESVSGTVAWLSEDEVIYNWVC